MELRNIAKFFKALANEQRLTLFKLIYTCQKEKSLGCSTEGVEKAFTMACNQLNLARSTVSHHMKELENAGLISLTRTGQHFTCQINRDAIKAIQQFLK